jgi:hypothetical protein
MRRLPTRLQRRLSTARVRRAQRRAARDVGPRAGENPPFGFQGPYLNPLLDFKDPIGFQGVVVERTREPAAA